MLVQGLIALVGRHDQRRREFDLVQQFVVFEANVEGVGQGILPGRRDKTEHPGEMFAAPGRPI